MLNIYTIIFTVMYFSSEGNWVEKTDAQPEFIVNYFIVWLPICKKKIKTVTLFTYI